MKAVMGGEQQIEQTARPEIKCWVCRQFQERKHFRRFTPTHRGIARHRWIKSRSQVRKLVGVGSGIHAGRKRNG